MILNLSKDEALIIFVKNPEKGKVKTRLAKTIGEEAALLAYIKLLAHTKKTVEKTKVSAFLFYDQQIAEDDWSPKRFIKKIQFKGDLGERIKAAFKEVFEKKYQKVIIIGSDCPDLEATIIQDAFKALDRYDYCIGPTEDQGYYLFGMKAYKSYPFENINWSTEQVLTQTIKQITDQNKTITLLPELYDVDYESEWKRSHLFHEK